MLSSGVTPVPTTSRLSDVLTFLGLNQEYKSSNTNKKCRSHFLKVADHQFKILFRGKMLNDKLNPLKILRSLFSAVLYLLLNMINFNLIIVDYELKYRL